MSEASEIATPAGRRRFSIWWNRVSAGWNIMALESLNSKTSSGQVKFCGVCGEGGAI